MVGAARADEFIRVVAVPGDVGADVRGLSGDVREVVDDLVAFEDFRGGLPEGRVEDKGGEGLREDGQAAEEEGDVGEALGGDAGVAVFLQDGEGADVGGPAGVAGMQGVAEFLHGGAGGGDEVRREEVGEGAGTVEEHGGRGWGAFVRRTI